MMMPERIDAGMLAPCGVNCIGCSAHHKQKKPCRGCKGPDEYKRPSCLNCVRKRCADERGLEWCFQCGEFPCKQIRTLDKSYRTRYGIYLVKKGRLAAERGAAAVVERDRLRLTCACGGVICQIDGRCSECGETIALPEEAYPE